MPDLCHALSRLVQVVGLAAVLVAVTLPFWVLG